MFIHALALELGMTVAWLCSAMTERELSAWMQYAHQSGGLPKKRMELLQADQNRMVHVGMCGGDKNALLSEYMFQPADEASDDTSADEVTVDDVVQMFGSTPYRKRVS